RTAISPLLLRFRGLSVYEYSSARGALQKRQACDPICESSGSEMRDATARIAGGDWKLYCAAGRDAMGD
ncbi:MAG: hypothetical protein R6V03_11175, partial [Kiritimatiellia bacterium]